MSVVLVGAGGHAKAVCEVIAAADDEIAAYVDARAANWLEAERIADDDAALAAPGGPIVIGIGGMTPAALRARLAVLDRYLEAGRTAPAVVHADAIVSRTAAVGAGAIVLAGAVVQPSALVGRGAIVNTRAVVEHDSVVGPGSHVAPGAIVLGGCAIGACAMIGAGAVVLPGQTVPDDAMIPALARYPR